MTSPSTADVHEFANDEELDALIDSTLQDAGVDLAELRRQAYEGRFTSEKQRRAWFVIEGLGRG